MPLETFSLFRFSQRFCRILTSAVFVLIALLILTACGDEKVNLENVHGATPQLTDSSLLVVTSPTVYISPHSAAFKDWQNRWLRGIPCKPPCWEGITPGSTSAMEASALLRQLPFITSVSLYPPSGNSSNKSGSVQWDWFDRSSFRGFNHLLFEPQSPNQVVSVIVPDLPDYKIKEVIQAYGNPSHVIATLVIHQPEDNKSWYQVYFIYSSQGFLLTKQFPAMPTLGSELELNAPDFFVPGINNLSSLQLTDYDLGRLTVPWQGFKDFRFYCRPVNFPLGEAGDNCNKIL